MDNELNSDIRKIYEQIGAIVQASQQMEFTISLSLTLLNQLQSGVLEDIQFNESMDKFSKQTLGRLLGAIKKHIEVNESIEDALKLTLSERNYIIHSFFHSEIEWFLTPDGRKKLLRRVLEARKNIDPGYKILDSIGASLMETSGMSLEQVMKEVEKSFVR